MDALAAARRARRRVAADGNSVVFIGRAGAAVGVAALEDEVKSEAPVVLAQLARRGLALAILSGDRPPAVARIAAALGVERWEASQSPAEKLAAVGRLGERLGAVAMVGDGINDGPVLAGAGWGSPSARGASWRAPAPRSSPPAATSTCCPG